MQEARVIKPALFLSHVWQGLEKESSIIKALRDKKRNKNVIKK